MSNKENGESLKILSAAWINSKYLKKIIAWILTRKLQKFTNKKKKSNATDNNSFIEKVFLLVVQIIDENETFFLFSRYNWCLYIFLSVFILYFIASSTEMSLK